MVVNVAGEGFARAMFNEGCIPHPAGNSLPGYFGMYPYHGVQLPAVKADRLTNTSISTGDFLLPGIEVIAYHGTSSRFGCHKYVVKHCKLLFVVYAKDDVRWHRT
jgi:hypothetical protein